MDLFEAIRSRRSIRGFKPDPVPRKILEEIIDVCQWAPSPGNMQPWEFAILGGEVMEKLRKRLVENTQNRIPSELEFPSPLKVPEKYDKRRTIYYRDNFDRYVYPPGTDNVEEKKKEYFAWGARLFDAPNAVLVITDRAFLNIPWGLISIGMLVQNFCLAATAKGLGTCVMGRMVDWPNILREMLNIDQTKIFICGIAVGYPDTEARSNNVPRIRMPVDEWVHWYGF